MPPSARKSLISRASFGSTASWAGLGQRYSAGIRPPGISFATGLVILGGGVAQAQRERHKTTIRNRGLGQILHSGIFSLRSLQPDSNALPESLPAITWRLD